MLSVCDRAEPDVGRHERRLADDERASRVRRLERPARVGAVCRPLRARLPRRAARRPGHPQPRLPPGRRQGSFSHRQPGHGRRSFVN